MNLRNGDTLNKDWPTDEPYTFDAVVMNPPYSANWSADTTFLDDSRFNRYGKLAPKSKADFAFLLHGFYHLKETGTMAIVLPHRSFIPWRCRRGHPSKITRRWQYLCCDRYACELVLWDIDSNDGDCVEEESSNSRCIIH